MWLVAVCSGCGCCCLSHDVVAWCRRVLLAVLSVRGVVLFAVSWVVIAVVVGWSRCVLIVVRCNVFTVVVVCCAVTGCCCLLSLCVAVVRWRW